MSKCKFEKQEKFYSDDNGISWLSTGEYRKGELIESGSTDCGFDGKFRLTYTDSSEYAVVCNSSPTLSSAETRTRGTIENITQAEIGSCVKIIGRNAFSGASSLSALTLPSGLTTIEQNAFDECSGFTSIILPDTVTSIGDSAFEYCYSLSSITIPNGVVRIRQSAFYSCVSLSSITLSNNLIEIERFAFEFCESLLGITIPSGVTSIGDYAFEYCENLSSVTCLSTTPPTLGNCVFCDTGIDAIYVPSDAVDTYKTASRWSSYKSKIYAIPNS